MSSVSIDDRFRGSCNLVILHLRRAAKSNNLESGFQAARSMGMLSPEQERFIRRCLKLKGQLEEGEAPDEPITDELIRSLQACTLSLNTADPA